MQRRKRSVQWLTYEQAGRIARENGCTSRKSFWNWHNRARPNNIPKMPDRVYPQWTTWGEWLATNNAFAKFEKDTYRPYWQAVRWVQPFCIKRQIDSSVKWFRFYDLHEDQIPKDIPKHAHYHYAENWQGWNVWLGKDIHSRLMAQQQQISVFGLITVPWAPKNQIQIVVANDGEQQLKQKIDNLGGTPLVVYRFDDKQINVYNNILNQYGSRQMDGSYIISNVDAMLFQFDTLLERVEL